ncbi:MAG: RlpA-like double-psi beta-barrel domain-containing protein [Actinomycetota bacterium]
MKKLLVITLLVAVGAPGAWADSIGHRVGEARDTQRSAQATLTELEAQLAQTSGELATAQNLLDAATVQLVDARSEEHDAEIRLALARDVLVQRVRAAYEQGPATTLDMLLSAKSASDLVSINEFTSHAILSDLDAVARVSQGKAELDRMRQAFQMRQQALVRDQRQVQRLLETMQARVQEAQQAAHAAGLRVQSLEATARGIERARSREAERATLLSSGSMSADEAKLLALLGPNGGRGCSIPSGLRATGQTISGEASWYGDEFAGGPTASGAVFDPSLFTAAHRTLPLGTFLRVHHGGSCAIVLVNDRGPFGDYHRIIDLAQGPAQYLGVGVSEVTADILVPR